MDYSAVDVSSEGVFFFADRLLPQRYGGHKEIIERHPDLAAFLPIEPVAWGANATSVLMTVPASVDLLNVLLWSPPAPAECCSEPIPDAEYVVSGCDDSFVLWCPGSPVIYVLGGNRCGQLGAEEEVIDTLQIVRLPCSAEKLVLSKMHCLVLDTEGNVWGWGSNLYGQLGLDSVTSKSPVVRICVEGVVDIAVSFWTSAFLLEDGSVLVTGTCPSMPGCVVECVEEALDPEATFLDAP
ncbi:MAG: uncharacterized protein KVP18_003421 [Porospora cf. gigantea A]|nr:MAG: hypothetical protein KVP18_003421 [Porospora cf. gigantea A]